MKNAAQVLQGLFKNSKSPLSEGFQRWRLEKNWSQVVGDQFSRYTRPVDFNRGTLVIAVNNSVLMTELQFFRSTLIAKVNEYVGYRWVKKIRLTSE